eukprot:m.164589 g.164589  ORF g.164589 m.164589 type:complete len:77 (+) comp38882_c1_seq17:4124-4354(+)
MHQCSTMQKSLEKPSVLDSREIPGCTNMQSFLEKTSCLLWFRKLLFENNFAFLCSLAVTVESQITFTDQRQTYKHI